MMVHGLRGGLQSCWFLFRAVRTTIADDDDDDDTDVDDAGDDIFWFYII